MADPSLQTQLEALAARFSSECDMVRTKLSRRNYHSSLPVGEQAHEVLGSLGYAILLLKHGGKAEVERARRIVTKVISLQNTDPCEPTYGIWPYYLEEPVARMAPPDWNWADFCGARLATMLAEHVTVLGEELVALMRDALAHAAWSIFRRNVQPDYTNIAVMGGGVTAVAGETLDEPRLLAYGRRRLERVLAYARQQGGFTEYNSPTYTMVTLLEAERTLQLVRDPVVRESAEGLRQLAWQTIARHYHPPTQQWAGPHARAYADHLAGNTVGLLNARLPQPITVHPRHAGEKAGTLEAGIRPLPCPAALVECFARLDPPEQEHHDSFARDHAGRSTVAGTTWLHHQATLASVNRGELWNQRRPLIGYWASDADPAVVLRVRLLKDDEDFASGYLRCIQKRNRVLCLMTMLRDGGDFHLFLDRPADGNFQAHDLRLRLELAGQGVEVRQLDAQRYVLAAGTWRAVVHLPETGPTLLEHNPRWESRQLDDRVVLDAVWWSGQTRTFNLATDNRPCWQAWALELLHDDEPASDAPLQIAALSDQQVAVVWEPEQSMRMESTILAHDRP
ncbi:MAG: hypothetical protein WD534_02750 [Phycisphaeraceae bacterium]